MRISVIIPAWNAAETLATALDSLRAQSFTDWEAIVVDDGSTDETSVVVERYAARDGRIRLVRQENGGLSAARNTGIRHGVHEWLHFLDADDWMAPTAFERFAEVLSVDPTLDAVHCGWARVAADGTPIAESRCWQDGDLFEQFAVRCAFAVHACLVRRSAVEAAGLFDASIHIAQDWMLWQRIARRGARFGSVPETLAFYAFRADSLSSDPMPLLREALAIIALGHGRDARIPDAVHAAGRPRHELAAAQLHYVCWVAGMLLGRGEDAVPLLSLVPRATALPAPAWIAESLVRAVPHSLGVAPTEWPRWWPVLAPALQRFLDALELHTGSLAFARAVRVAFERSVAVFVTSDATTLGLYHVVQCEVTAPIGPISIPLGVERLAVSVLVRGERIGLVELPVVDGHVRDVVLQDAIADALAWPILGRFFDGSIYQACEFRDDGTRCSAWLGGVQLAGALPTAGRARLDALHDAAGWELFLREVWGPTDESPANNAPIVPDENGWTAVEVSQPAEGQRLVHPQQQVYPEQRAQPHPLVAMHVGGVAIAALPMERDERVITPVSFHARLSDAVGFELCRAAVREGLLGSSWDGAATLRQRLALAAARLGGAHTGSGMDENTRSGMDEKRRGGGAVHADEVTGSAARFLAPGWTRQVVLADPNRSARVLLARRANRSVGGSGSRFYSIPEQRVRAILEVEQTEGTPILRQSAGVGGLYAPSLLWRHDAILASVAPSRERVDADESATDTRIPNDDALPPTLSNPAQRLPILMYHRVAPDGAPERVRWRVTPDAFEAQMVALRERGFRTVGLREWRLAMDSHTSLRGRPAVITFDDGYSDLAEFAWPVLRRHGLGAMAFIVTGSVGRCNTWDAGGEQEPLMDWSTLRRLRNEGLTFGAHSVTHRRMTSLTPDDMFGEAVLSRQALQEELGESVDAFAFPFGDEDPVARHTIGAAGFDFGLSVRGGAAARGAPRLSLPRIEITNEDDVASFIAKLES